MKLLPCRSKQALLWSIETLFDNAEAAARRHRSIYFWTFTWPCVGANWEYRPSWRRFVELMSRYYTGDGFQGVNVWERHPSGHGLHVHCLWNERLPMPLVRRVGVHCGLGKVMWAEKITREDAPYVAKYVSKDGRLAGIRMWATMGNWRAVQCRDLEFDSKESRDIKSAYKTLREYGELPHKEAFAKAQRFAAAASVGDEMLSRDNIAEKRREKITREQLFAMCENAVSSNAIPSSASTLRNGSGVLSS